MTRPLLTLLILTLPVVAGPAEDARKLAADFQRAKLAYAQKLDALMVAAKGDAAAEKEIAGLIAEVEGKKAETGDDLAPLVGTWQHDGDASVWRITSPEEGSVNGKYKIAISYDHEKRRAVVISPSWVNYLTFTDDPDVINGSYEERGRTRRFKLTRVK